jgi:hypothetical protein
MPIALTLTQNNVDGSPSNFCFAAGTLTFSGNYTTGGDELDFTPIMNLLPTSQAPVQVAVFSQGGTAFAYVAVQGSSFNNWKLKVFAPGGTEITGGAAYPGAVTGDTVAFQILARKLL